ncbi:MAG: response regulator [Rhizobacter sp.]|nr:response regulator [Chlorobiales bacterium]
MSGLQSDQKSLLIIDDDKSAHDLYTATLAGMNFRFKSVMDGWAGYKEIREAGHKYDLVLLDITMPAMNGLEILHRLNEEKVAYPPTIVISGNDDKDLTATCMEAGATDFLKKPVRTSFLKAAVKDVLGIGDDMASATSLTQMMADITRGKRSGTVTVTTNFGKGTIIYNVGKLIGVSYAGLSRLDALEKLKDAESQKIEFEPR